MHIPTNHLIKIVMNQTQTQDYFTYFQKNDDLYKLINKYHLKNKTNWPLPDQFELL